MDAVSLVEQVEEHARAWDRYVERMEQQGCWDCAKEGRRNAADFRREAKQLRKEQRHGATR